MSNITDAIIEKLQSQIEEQETKIFDLEVDLEEYTDKQMYDFFDCWPKLESAADVMRLEEYLKNFDKEGK